MCQIVSPIDTNCLNIKFVFIRSNNTVTVTDFDDGDGRKLVADCNRVGFNVYKDIHSIEQ